MTGRASLACAGSDLARPGLNFPRTSIKYARLKPVTVMPPKNGACSDITDSKLASSPFLSLSRAMASFGCRDGVQNTLSARLLARIPLWKGGNYPNSAFYLKCL